MKNTSLQKKRPRGRPVNEAAREEIIACAAKMFMEHGFQRTTMDNVARTLSISKLTLYNRFPNKEALFTAVIVSKCEEYIPDNLFCNIHGVAPEKALFNIGFGLLSLLTSHDALNMERMLMAEAREKPKLTQIFYDAGPKRVKAMIAGYLTHLHEKKMLHIPDAMLATHMFTALFKGSDICFRLAMHIPPKPTNKQIKDYCHHAVRLFLAAHKK